MGYDAIVLARGGGSIEDLWSFNDEELAKVIYNLKTFIITTTKTSILSRFAVILST